MRKVDAAGNTTTAERTRPSYVTPTQFAALSPSDGDEAYIVVDATNGVIWHMRYNGGSASAFKWEFLGGASMRVLINTQEACTNGSFADLATVQSLIMPRAGDYEVEWGARNISISTGNSGPTADLDYPGHAAAFDFQEWAVISPTGSAAYTGFGKLVITIATAGDTLKVKYQANAGVSSSVGFRYTFVRPVRLS
jgi:hypothetical protein